jgi:hypothetical protein
MNRIDLKERIAISDAYSNEERDFLLLAINSMPEVEMDYQAPRNYMGRISALWAYLSVDEGGEGVVAAPLGPDRMTVPLIAADRQRLELLRAVAVSTARSFNKTVRLVRFHSREDVEIIRP